MVEDIKRIFYESINVKKSIAEDNELLMHLNKVIEIVTKCLADGNKLIICGNGGSASDSLHFAGEIVGRFLLDRNPWPAIVLNTDMSVLTAIANDYGYDDVFARQAEAHVKKGDVFFGISTSGDSENVLRAANVCKEKGAVTVGFLGNDGGRMGKVVDYPLTVPHNVTARVQECHILMIHTICDITEKNLVGLQ